MAQSQPTLFRAENEDKKRFHSTLVIFLVAIFESMICTYGIIELRKIPQRYRHIESTLTSTDKVPIETNYFSPRLKLVNSQSKVK